MTHPKTPFRGFKRPKGVRGTSGRPVNIDFRFQHMFLRIDALIRNLFQGGARYPLLPTRLIGIVCRSREISGGGLRLSTHTTGLSVTTMSCYLPWLPITDWGAQTSRLFRTRTLRLTTKSAIHPLAITAVASKNNPMIQRPFQIIVLPRNVLLAIK